jgi:hypothetical protein
MEPYLIIAVATMALWVARRFALRQMARGRTQYIWLFFAPTLVWSFAVIGVGLYVTTKASVVGVAIAVLGAVTFALQVRMLRHQTMSTPAELSTGDISPEAIDYIIWMAVGLPMVFAIGLVILGLSGALSRG